MRLVIIEDDRDAADYHAEAFREAGHVADLAADGEEGLAQAVDRTLPKLDGLTVIGTLRSKASRRPRSFFRRWGTLMIGSRGCGRAATRSCCRRGSFGCSNIS